MAYIEVTGFRNVMARLADEENGFRGRVTKALELAAGELREQLWKEEATTFIAPTGELGETIGWGRTMFYTSSAQILVNFKGNYHGRRAQEPRRAGFVAAMVEYKHNNPWNRRAREAAAPRINSILQEQLAINRRSAGSRIGVGSDWGGL